MAIANFLGIDNQISVRDSILYVTGSSSKTVQLGPHQRIAIVVVTGAFNVTITLPSVAIAKGSWFFVHKNSTPGNVFITSKGDDGQLSNFQMTTQHANVAIYSDGYVWYPIVPDA